MKPRKPTLPLLLTLLTLLTLALADAPTSFCKCTCGDNSTIIALTPPPSPSSTPPHQNLARAPGASSCSDCNRRFCWEYNLPICKGWKEEDIITTCFQRDSRKDEAVVFIFIFATVALLIYAAVRPWVERYLAAARERSSYIPVTNYEDE